MVDWLEHAERYEWMRVEADDAGALDDIVARKRDGTGVYRQSKFAVHADQANDLWTWKALLKQATGRKGQKLPSLLQDWATSLQLLSASTPQMNAALYSNRDATYEIRQACRQDDATLLDFALLPMEARQEITAQLVNEENAQRFFQHFHFLFNQPHLPELEDGLKRRFFRLAGTIQGWLSLKGALRSWVCHRNSPPPDGHIRLSDIRRAALWNELAELTQEFAIPNDYVPPKAFLQSFTQDVLCSHARCIVLSGSPGIGKSTFISYLYKHFRAKLLPVVRHHYDLGSSDHTPGFRLDHWRAATSLMHDLAHDHTQALGSLTNTNPQPGDLRPWLIACGAYYARAGKTLTILVDGLDHVWRERRSVEDLTRLLEYLLPAPEGVVIVFATQPVDDHQLPPLLLRHAPRDHWVALSSLDEPAVEQWVRKHASDFPLQAGQLQSTVVTNRLAKALYRKGNGHPLHLHYTLKAMQERQLAFTEETIEALPGCPHEGITAYYTELWRALPEESKAIMHLFAASRFPWPSEGIIACLDPQRYQIAQVRDHLLQVRHLLVYGDLGLFPCHSSIIAFVSQLPEYQEYRKPHLQKARLWLQQEAPDYWRWAYMWEIEAALGNDAPLSQGPNRQWVIDALAARRPSRDITNLLHSSMQRSLHQANLPRLIELGLLLDYGVQACESYRDIREQLLYAQLQLEDDPYIRTWLLAHLDDVTDGELVLLAEHALAQGDQQTFNRCCLLVSERLLLSRRQQETSISRSWQERYTPQLALDAMSDDERTMKQALALLTKNRGNHAISQEILTLYSEHLRIWHNIDPLRTLLTFPIAEQQTEQIIQEEPVLLTEEAMLLRRHTALLALEEDLDVDELVSSAAEGDPCVALYAAIHHLPYDPLGIMHLPDHTLLNLRRYEVFERPFEVRECFAQAFFGFLANHLSGKRERNGAWLRVPGTRTWALRFLQELNACTAIVAAKIQASAPIDFGAFFVNLSRIVPPDYEEEDRAAFYYYKAACDAAVDIGLDLMIVVGAACGDGIVITQAQLTQALASPYCDIDIFLQRVVSRRRPVLEDAAVQWLLDDQERFLRTAISPCADRAKRCAQLSALAILHRNTEQARQHIAQCAEHLLAHAYHKDMLFYNVLSALQRYAQTTSTENMHGSCWPWLAQLAPAIAGILDYTDGDETRNFSAELAETLALAAPEKLVAYYVWQCERSDYGQVVHTLHAFLEHANLEEPMAHSLAMTAIDQVSLGIIARRAAQDDTGAQIVQERIQTNLGTAAFAFTKSRTDQLHILEGRDAAAFDPARHSPSMFVDTDTSLEDLPGPLSAWIDYWAARGQKKEVYRVLTEADMRGIDIECYDQLFMLARSLYGKAKAYPWLVKAHIRGNGWSWYISRQDEAEQRWRMLKQHYPEKWQAFLQDTLLQMPLWRSGSFSHGEFRRLIEYCLFMGQRDLAQRLVEQMVKRSLELVSMLPFPTPNWVDAS
ncbi:hypothetical protein KSZ_62070 [Dictyobacter formicarum]|uniref:NACHT domain-containing protein n=2 Tax=Dictyobacter formicarum TaxID=2778368 RepID=A0ABQ3VSV1_9CHLR|nr:hypothetical protein KSZ_62070 [Dictyobacter formicarum]